MPLTLAQLKLALARQHADMIKKCRPVYMDVNPSSTTGDLHGAIYDGIKTAGGDGLYIRSHVWWRRVMLADNNFQAQDVINTATRTALLTVTRSETKAFTDRMFRAGNIRSYMIRALATIATAETGNCDELSHFGLYRLMLLAKKHKDVSLVGQNVTHIRFVNKGNTDLSHGFLLIGDVGKINPRALTFEILTSLPNILIWDPYCQFVLSPEELLASETHGSYFRSLGLENPHPVYTSTYTCSLMSLADLDGIIKDWTEGTRLTHETTKARVAGQYIMELRGMQTALNIAIAASSSEPGLLSKLNECMTLLTPTLTRFGIPLVAITPMAHTVQSVVRTGLPVASVEEQTAPADKISPTTGSSAPPNP